MRLADDAALQAAFDAEFDEFMGRPQVMVRMSPLVAWALVAQLQLASRHPANHGPTVQIVRKWAAALMEHVDLPPAMAQVYQGGWDPEQDVPPDRSFTSRAQKKG